MTSLAETASTCLHVAHYMREYDVTHETGSTQRIGTSPEDERAATTGHRHRRSGEDQTCLSGDMLAVRRRQTNTNKQTDRHGHRNTSLP